MSEFPVIETVTKRSGEIEKYAPEKLVKWTVYGTNKLKGRIQMQPIISDVVSSLYEGIPTDTIQSLLIDRALQVGTWPGQLMAGALYAPTLHKEVHGESIPSVYELHQKLHKLGLMKKMPYSKKEYDTIETFMDHTHDFDMAHFQIKQVHRKYSITNRTTGKIYETPQFTYIRMAMEFCSKEPSQRLFHVSKMFDHLKRTINAPTPNYTNAGTYNEGLLSCAVSMADDSIDSLWACDTINYNLTSIGSGIGTYIQSRSINDSVRGGAIEHNGKLPYYALQGKEIKANMQGARAGAGTTYYDCFDPEAATIATLQNPRTPESRRNRDIHFAVKYHPLFIYKAALDQEVFTFNVQSAPDLMKAFHGKDKEKFKALYEKYEADPTFKKNYVNARDLLVSFEQQAYDVGTHYNFFVHNANYHTPFKEAIHSSNLCVAPETPILTRNGNLPIGPLAGTKQEVWNGSEWSEVDVVKTGENQKLLKVTTSDGRVLECTPYHKWYVALGYSEKMIKEVRTYELEPGMRLIKFDFPVQEGSKSLDKAYENGFYSGDGCLLPNGQQRLYFYGRKRALMEHCAPMQDIYDQPNQDRIYGHYRDLEDKYFVPDSTFSIKARLDWLAGYVDADGSVYYNGPTETLAMTSINKEFLLRVRDMLNCSGIQVSFNKCSDGGNRMMPANDGTGLLKEFYCQEQYRLTISAFECKKLMELGFKANRIRFNPEYSPNRSARQFNKIISVEDLGRTDDTYCFTEPKRNMGVFNGILTGQCLEIMEPNFPYENIQQLFHDGYFHSVAFRSSTGDNIVLEQNRDVYLLTEDGGFGYALKAGEIEEGMNIVTAEGQEYHVAKITRRDQQPEVAFCSLAGIVEPNVRDDDDYREACYYAMKMIDYTINNSSFKYEHMKFTARKRLNAGLGLLGAATSMAREGVRYDTTEGLNKIHRMAERHMYFALEASLRLGEELGNAPWMHKTKWAEGWLPIDTYSREVDKFCTQELLYEWENLRSRIIANRGIRFSVNVAHMPTESSSKASGVPNGWYPVRETAMTKSDANNLLEWAAVDSDLLEDSYQSSWETSRMAMIRVYAVIQKFTDQGISADLYANRTKTLDLSAKTMIEELIYMQVCGLKSRYYLNSKTNGDADISQLAGCGSGGCTL